MKEMMVNVGDGLPEIPEGYEVAIFERAKKGDMYLAFGEWDEVPLSSVGNVFNVLLRKKSDPLVEWANANENFQALARLVRDGYGLFVDPDGDPPSGWYIQCAEKSKSEDLAVLDLGVPPDGVEAAPLRYDHETKSWVRA